MLQDKFAPRLEKSSETSEGNFGKLLVKFILFKIKFIEILWKNWILRGRTVIQKLKKKIDLGGF